MLIALISLLVCQGIHAFITLCVYLVHFVYYGMQNKYMKRQITFASGNIFHLPQMHNCFFAQMQPYSLVIAQTNLLSVATLVV